MEAGKHSIWISEQLQELGHHVIVAKVRELRASSHSDLASRGGKQTRNRAIVAVARKLAVLLHRIWITQEPYVPFHAVAA